MKILFLSQRFLLPMDTGGKIRTGNILKQLAKTHEITLISNVESPKDDPYISKMDKYSTKFISVPWRETKKYSLLFYLRLFFKLFSIYPVSVLNDYSKELKSAVEKECANAKYDVAICDFVQSALNFKNIKNIPTILFQHNVESEIARRHFQQSLTTVVKIFWYLQWKRMYSFEKKTCRTFNIVIAVSDKDKSFFNQTFHLDNVETIPTGVDVDYFIPQTVNIENHSLIFCGSMDWLPNEDAILFFVKDILPHIKNRIPGIKLNVVGRNPSPSLQKFIRKYPEIHLTGWVKDIRPYIAASSLYVVPMRIGGGTRLKIYEAMAMGKTIISTSVGAEGLPAENGKHLIIENDPIKFSNRIIALLNDHDKRKEIGETAAGYVREKFTWQKAAKRFSEICQWTIG